MLTGALRSRADFRLSIFYRREIRSRVSRLMGIEDFVLFRSFEWTKQLSASPNSIPFIHLFCLRKLMSSNFSYFLLFAKVCPCFMTLANTKRVVINYFLLQPLGLRTVVCPWNHYTLTQRRTTALVFAWTDTSEKDFAITSLVNSSVCLFLCSLGNWNASKSLLLS